MKRWIPGALAALLLLPCAFAQTGYVTLPPTHETECDVLPSTSNASVSCTVSGLAGGETVILSTYRTANPTLVSLTDSAGQTPLLFDTHVDGFSGFDGFVLANAAAGSHTFTLTVSTAVTYLGLRADVFANAALANPIDTFSWATSCSGSNAVGAPLATYTNGELVFAWARADAGALTAAAGYTLDPSAGNAEVAGETTVLTLAGSTTASFGGATGAGNCDVRTVALKSFQADASGPPRHWTECDAQPSSSSTTVACTVNGLLGGEAVILNTVRPNNSALVSLTDSASQTPILFDTEVDATPTGSNAFVLQNAAAGSHTFTLTVATAQSNLGIRADVFASVPAQSPVSAFTWNGAACSTSFPVAAPITTVTSNALVFAWARAASGTLTVPAGYTSYVNQSSGAVAAEGTVLTTPSVATPNFMGGSGVCNVRAIVLKSSYLPTGYVTMTASALQDQGGSGQPIANATGCFQLTNLGGVPIAVHVGGAGGGQAAPRQNCAPITNGALVGTWQPADPTAGGTNMVPDPVFNGSLGTNWTNPGGAWAILRAGPNGTNLLTAFSGASQTAQSSASAAIGVVPGQVYTASAWIDATTVAAAEPELEVVDATTSSPIAELRQAAGVAGALRIAFTVPAATTSVKVLAAVHGATIGSGELGFGTVMLQAGSARVVDTNLSNPQNPGYTFTATDNLTGNIVLGGPDSGYSYIQPQFSETSPMTCVNGLCDLGTYVPTSTPGVTQFVAPAGPPPTLNVGAVTTLPPGTPASATVTGTPPNYFIALGIPQGSPGTAGAPGRDGVTNDAAVYPETYGALGNGKAVFDSFSIVPGVSSFGTMNPNASSPVIYTQAANDLVLTYFSSYDAWSTAPSGTARTNVAGAGGCYGLLTTEQPVTSPGSVAALTGIYNSAGGDSWRSLRLALKGETYVSEADVCTPVSSNIIVTAPASISAGNLLVAAVAYRNGGGNYLIPPSGWTLIGRTMSTQNLNGPGPEIRYLDLYTKTATGSEPSTYTWTQNFSAYNVATGAIVNYSGSGGVDGNTSLSVIQSYTAGFSGADVGKLICTQMASSTLDVRGYQKSKCGAIAAFDAPYGVTPSFTPDVPVSGWETKWATDDYAAFNTMLTTAPCSTTGCKMNFSKKVYGLSHSLVLPYDASLDFEGGGAALDWSLPRDIYDGHVPPAVTGTHLSFLTTSLSGAAVQASAPTNQFQNGTALIFKNLTLDAGVGFDASGGGNLGVFSSNFSNVTMDGVFITNFASGGWQMEGNVSNAHGFYVLNTFKRGFVTLNGGPAFELGPNGDNLENTSITDSEVEGNSGPAVDLAGNIQGFTYQNSLSQWNNVASAAADLKLESGATISGCNVGQGNYFELDSLLGGNSNAVMTNAYGAAGCQWGNNTNFIAPASVPRFLTFSAAGTPVPTCSTGFYQMPFTSVYVSDSTACTSGTTYTSGGTTTCKLLCNGTAWVETGYQFPY